MLTESRQTATARSAMLSGKRSLRVDIAAPPPAPAQGGLIWFTNQAEFEAFNAGEGKVLKGIEDYEESILDRNAADSFDDPLESGVANLPDGFPFPNGLTGLPNLTVQSNFEHDAFNPNPRGVNGLLALSDEAVGVVSDVVVANFFIDSLDLFFTDEKSGVGFNPISIQGLKVVDVSVFSTDNVWLGLMPSPADPSGASFIGVWSPIPIGRINIFDPGMGAEGADNIQVWEEGEPCPWDLVPDGSVGIADLLLLLELWNNPYVIGDLLDLLSFWGDCPPIP